MNGSHAKLKSVTRLALSALALVLLAQSAEAGLFNRRRDVIVVPSSAYVVADPYVVTSSYVAVPTRTVVEVPTTRVYSVPTVERVVVPSSRIYAGDEYLVPASRVYAAPEVMIPTVRPTRVLVPSTRVYEIYP